MKKSFFLATLASLAMVSCANIEQDIEKNPVSDTPITFSSPVMTPNTKTVNAVGEVSTYRTNEQFVVYANWFTGNFDQWSNGTKYMDAVTTTYKKETPAATSGAWFPDKTYYWPKNGTLTFAAYSPVGVTDNCTGIAYGNTGLTITDFTVPAKGFTKAQATATSPTTYTDVQYDLMFSDRAADKSASTGSASPYEGVDLKFRHALSSVQFTIKTNAAYTGYAFTLKSVTLKNIRNNGSFAEKVADNATATTTAEWTVTDVAKANYVAYTNAGEAITDAPKKINAYTEGKDFILLPQTLTDSDQQVEIVWTMKSPTGDVLEQTSTLDLKGGGITEWAMGKRYIYNIVIGLDEIYFNPVVENWTEVNGTDMAI